MQSRKTAKLLSAVMAVSMVSAASAATITFDSATTAGIQTANGTWDLNGATNWTTDGGTTRGAWTSNSNTAEFQMPGTGTVTVSDANGAVGASGLQFSGTGALGNMYMMNNGSAVLQLGAGGITAAMSDQLVQFSNSSRSAVLPLNLTASQTWSSTAVRTNANGASIRAWGAISGTADLTLDGKGVSNAYVTTNSANRVAIAMGGTNTYVGTTTVTGGVALWLDYANIPGSGSKLDDNSALVLSGGSIVLNGGTGIVETVGSTTVNAGANSVYAGANGGGGTTNKIALGALTHNLSGTVDVTTAVAGIASTTTQNTNGIIGGWATMGGASWAVGSADGVTATNITNTNGSDRSASSTWGATENVNVTAIESGVGSKTVNALRIKDTGEGLTLAAGSTLTITSGGIIAGNTSQYINDGTVTTGAGELFVHTPYALRIGAVIADNGAVATTLVKTGANNLVVSAENSYTGETYINSGALVVDGSLANSDITITAGLLTGTGLLNFNIVGDSSDLISIQGGSVDPSGLDLNLVTSGTQTMSEYVLADNAAGFAAGQTFANLTLNGGAAAGWAVDYDGTPANPGRVVLVVPEPGTIGLLVGVVSLGLMRRQRRHLARA